MREKYESLALVQLKELAKVRGIKGVSTMKKAEVVEAMLAEDEKDRAREETARAEKSTGKAEPVRAESPRGESARTESSRGESARTDSPRGDGSRSETTRTEPTRTEGEQPRPVRVNEAYDATQYPAELDSGIEAQGILEVMPDGYGFMCMWLPARSADSV